MRKHETSALKRRVDETVRHRPEIVGVYLFGSRARGEHTAASDADFGVLSREPLALDAIVALEQELDAATGMRVDVIDLARTDAFLALEAVRGERVFERDGRHLDEFELYVLRRAGDLAPFERERRRFLLSTAERS